MKLIISYIAILVAGGLAFLVVISPDPILVGIYLYTVMFMYDLFLKPNKKLKIELLLPSILIFKYPKISMALSFFLMVLCGKLIKLIDLPSTISLWALLFLYLFLKRLFVISQDEFVNLKV